MTNETRERADVGANLPRVLSLSVHELRTPVTVVAGYLRMLLRGHGGPLTDTQRKMIEEADRSCGRIAALVAEMSELGKLEAGELGLPRATFDLAEVAAEAAAGMDDLDRGVRVEPRASGRLTVTGDRARTLTAVRALVHAAVRERVEPGVIVAACTGDDTRGVVAIGDHARVAGAAGVPGTASADFDEWRGGMGLSLPVARRVIEAAGGSLWTVGDGDGRVTGLTLPLSRQDGQDRHDQHDRDRHPGAIVDRDRT